jgi:parallel beta-helix repeat protein
VKFAQGAELLVAYSGDFGTLIAQGASDNKITFTSAAPAGFENPGDWHGIFFYDGTGSQTILDYCNVLYGGGWISASGNLNVQDCAAGVPMISNCSISYSENWGIYIQNASPTLTSNTYSNNALGNVGP